MGHEFKPGDLALIIKGQKGHENNIGKVVNLCFMVADQESYSAPGGYVQTNCSGSLVWVVQADCLTNPSPWTGWAQCAPENLMPLKGDEQSAQVRQAERVS